MQQALRKITPPAIGFLVFLILAFISDGLSLSLGADDLRQWEQIVRYMVQMGTIISGLFFLNRLITVFIWDHFIAKMLESSVPRLVKDLVAALIGVVGVTLVVGVVFKKPITGIWATSGALGVVVGFALRSLILDAFTGLAINIDTSYNIGDWVHVHSRNREAYIGCILEINWRTTRIQTTDNNIVILPNRLIGRSIVTNFSSPTEVSRFELHFCFDAALPSDRVIRVLLAGVKNAIVPTGIEAEPEPTVRINQVTDRGVEYRIRYWLQPAVCSPPKARHAIVESVLHNIHTAGIQLAHPKQDVFYVRRPSSSFISAPVEDRLAILSTIDLFRPLETKAMETLALQMKRVSFKHLDKVVTLDAKSDSMFIVVEGLLDVYVRDKSENQDVKVATLTSGQFFGEFALLTGQPRSATVIASTEVVAYEITYSCMRDLFNRYPEVLETISGVIADRQLRNQRLLAELHQPRSVQTHQTVSDDIRASIRHFFGLRRKQ